MQKLFYLKQCNVGLLTRELQAAGIAVIGVGYNEETGETYAQVDEAVKAGDVSTVITNHIYKTSDEIQVDKQTEAVSLLEKLGASAVDAARLVELLK